MKTDTYKITKIDAQTGDITVSFSVDGKEQVLSGMPLNDLSFLNNALTEYHEAYKAGLEVEQITVAPEITDIIGQTKDVIEVASLEPLI